jgi:hypothetical protein
MAALSYFLFPQDAALPVSFVVGLEGDVYLVHLFILACPEKEHISLFRDRIIFKDGLESVWVYLTRWFCLFFLDKHRVFIDVWKR